MVAQRGTKGREAGAAARRMQAVPYFAAKMPEPMIAKMFKVSESAVRKWAQHPDVRKALGEVSEHVVATTKTTAEQIARKALEAIDYLAEHAEDERVRLDAAKTALDRFGYPATTKSESTQDVRQLVGVVRFDSKEQRDEIANDREGKEG